MVYPTGPKVPREISSMTNTLRLDSTDKRLQFIQMLRDEAHRSAITFHKKSKLKLDQHSKLLSIHGISQAKIHKLIEYFGTFEAIEKSDFETLSDLIGAKDAKNIQNCYLKRYLSNLLWSLCHIPRIVFSAVF